MQCLLTLNVGSSSVKCRVYALQADALVMFAECLVDHRQRDAVYLLKNAKGDELSSHKVEWTSIKQVVSYIPEMLRLNMPKITVVAVGHRVVHGGVQYVQPQVIDATMLANLQARIDLAPLHLPPEITGIEVLSRVYPDALHVACFDTAFHAQQAETVRMYAIPRTYTDAGVKRYGFHGLSYEYIAQAMPDIMGPQRAAGRVIVLHLGSGASACGMIDGKSVASSMGFTALEGLMMSTRCGSIDAGVIFYMQRHYGLSLDAIERIFIKESGLQGVSGISGDVRVLEASDHPHAQQALNVFAYRVVREIGSLAAAIGGLDALVFAAGIGEHSVRMRAAIAAQLAWLGVVIDDEKNKRHQPDISAPSASVGTYIIPTDEEQMIARHTQRLFIGITL
jgi:acetate kinase